MEVFKHRPIRILWQGEWAIHTGFGQVSKNILDRLYSVKTEWGTPKFEIHVMSLTTPVDPLNGPPGPQNGVPYKVYPMLGNRGSAPFGHDYAQELIKKIRPDIVIAFGDTWMVDYWNEPGVINPELRKTFKLVGYIAIDGYPLPDFWVEKFQKFDKIITFSKFGKDTIEERAKQLGRELSASYIHHGVNPQVFKPLPKSDIDNFRKSRGITPEKKIIGMVARNQPRKHHPEYVQFAARLLEISDNNPDYMFYLHTIERDAGWDLPAIIRDIDTLGLIERGKTGYIYPGQDIPEKKFSLLGRFVFPGITNPAEGYPQELLNMMYNICDAHILFTSGEGFGVPVIESLAAGVPTFTNAYAASQELVEESGGGETFKASHFSYRGQDHNFIRPHSDIDDAIDKVLKIYKDDSIRTKYKKKARAYGLSKSWDIIIEEWVEQLDSLYNDNQLIKTEVV